ncbi:MAG: MATE family efflux transporter [Clostridia bacterium]|nr:MATE family efflux transporter [Clostridia bacterium]
MGTYPIPRLLISMSVPIMVSMLVQALYNIIDSIFVAQISAEQLELTAVSVAFPLQNLIIAFASGMGVGITALISRSLGEKKADDAGHAAAQGILIELFCYAIFLIIGLFFVRPFFESQTTNPAIIEYGVQYLSICCVASFGVFMQIVFEKFLQSTGKTVLSMVTQATGAVINIILDPILIFGWFGLPAMGIRGAAIATVIGQIFGAILAILLHFKKNKEIKIHLRDFRPDGRRIMNILAVGIPSVAMMSIGSLMTFLLNKILFSLEKVGEVAATVFGIYFKLQSFVLMPCIGLNNGMLPIVAYNYGARNKKRITATIKLAITVAICLMCVGVLIFQIMPDQLLGLFDANEGMMEIGRAALRIISIHFIFAAFNIVMVGTFQAFGNGVFSLIISFVRQIIVLIPTAFLFSRIASVNEIWFAFPIAEFSALILCTCFYIYLYKKKIKNL